VTAAQDGGLGLEVGDVEWYHTIELRPGVVTPGWFDTREVAERLPWPDLAGKRCLDVGTFEGFWAFEMERRGAADVLAIDILDPHAWDWPRGSSAELVRDLEERKRGGQGFLLARQALGSAVVRRELSVYDLDPADVGVFDVVYLGSLLLHLRDPVRALERVHDVLSPGGHLLSVDAVDLELTALHPRRAVASFDGNGRPWWWKVNRVAHRRLLESAGFQVVASPRPFVMPAGRGQDLPRLRWRHLLHAAGREALVTRTRRGDPHEALLAVKA
jgi:tRNA (mo5U34)-methyltransferase